MWHLSTNGLVGVTVQYTVMHAYNPISRLRMPGVAAKLGPERVDTVCMMLCDAQVTVCVL
jgi:hypothetical protein